MASAEERPSGWLRLARVASRVTLLIGAVAMGVVLALVAFPERRPEPFQTVERGWRGAYHPDLLFLGKPLVRIDTEIDFDWRDGKPHPAAPRNRLSVRWDTCLELPQAATLEIRVGADDGIRAFVDGEQVVSDWGEHAFRRRVGAHELEAGVHHVVVEYYEKAGSARAEAMLVLLTEPEREVPVAWMRPPDRDHDHESPCGR